MATGEFKADSNAAVHKPLLSPEPECTSPTSTATVDDEGVRSTSSGATTPPLNGGSAGNGEAGLTNGGPAGGVLNVKQAPLAAANTLIALELDQPVQLRTGRATPNPEQDFEPLCVHELFARTVRLVPDAPAIVCKRDGVERRWSYLQYYRECVSVAKALLALGLKRFDVVCILGFNAPEWFFTNIGTIFAGGVAAGIYATNSSDACQFIINHAQAKVLVAENAAQLKKLAALQLKNLGVRAVVQYTESSKHPTESVPEFASQKNDVQILTWKEFIALGEGTKDSEVEKQIAQQAPNHCAELIYTSGTTGSPKGVMLSQDNLTWMGRTAMGTGFFEFGRERSVSYLPLSHSAGQITDIYLPVTAAACIHFARPDALRGTLVDTLVETQPTYFFGVPRVWEKFQEKITKAVSESSSIRQKIFSWSQRTGLEAGYAAMNKGELVTGGCSYKIADRLVFSKLRERLGFTHTHTICTAAAPIMKETLDFFLSVGIPILEIFGMTESTGPQTFSSPRSFRIGSCGNAVRGTKTIFKNPDADGEGELVIDGRNIFMGYLHNLEENQLAFDENNCLRTGDLGKVDENGFYYITGRIKELVITAGGENIAPVAIENRLKLVLPSLISNCMLVGDRRKFLSMLITLRVEPDPETLVPTDRLASEARAFLEKECGLKVATVTELLAKPKEARGKLEQVLKDALEKVNQTAVSRAWRVQICELLPRDFSMAGGELGPTLKLRRGVVLKKYAQLINQYYAEAEAAAAAAGGAD